MRRSEVTTAQFFLLPGMISNELVDLFRNASEDFQHPDGLLITI
jgi:hypothetical protein